MAENQQASDNNGHRPLNLPTPKPFDGTPANWLKWRQRFQRYWTASGLMNRSRREQFRPCGGGTLVIQARLEPWNCVLHKNGMSTCGVGHWRHVGERNSKTSFCLLNLEMVPNSCTE